MKKPRKKTGAPRKPPDKSKAEYLQIRVNSKEKEAFQAAADLDGKKLSEWIRDRLRRLSEDELTRHGQEVPFLPTNG
jgi:uncharacterized protein (DUF1778 family)